jgi:GNAT superfamily N-acetyltransferase
MIGVRLISPTEFVGALPAMREVFREALGYRSFEPRVLSFTSLAREHVQRDGFRAAAAFDGRVLVGFTYGYNGARGQWWHDQVARRLSAEDRKRWLDGAFELVELHLRPDHQGQGLGGRLHDLLLEDVRRPTAVLSTPAREGRAMQLYRARGWVILAEGKLFEGVDEDFRVLGLRLRPGAPSSPT